MSKKERVKKLLGYGFSYGTISNNSHYWNNGDRIPEHRLRLMVGDTDTLSNNGEKYSLNKRLVTDLDPVKRDEAEFIVAAKNRGLTRPEIAEQLGISIAAVQTYTKKYIIRNR